MAFESLMHCELLDCLIEFVELPNRTPLNANDTTVCITKALCLRT